jgi:hypothetical protein
MRPRTAAFGLWAALTFSCAVVVHGVVHAVGAQAFVWDSPAHVVMLAVALGLLAAVATPLGLVGRARERRRRIALVRARLGPLTLGTAAFGALTQAGVAALLLVAEGTSLEPARLALALACGLVALICTAFLFRATRDRVVALLAAFAAAVDLATAPPPLRRVALRPARATVPYRLFVPNRPPPLPA